MMFDVDDTVLRYSRPRELSQMQALINNGLDFLIKPVKSLEAQPKFSVVSFWTAVEILLSSAGARTLVVGLQPGKANKKQAYLAGDFQSVTYEETRERLKDVLERPL
ncbi:hypothetical protein O5290_21940 [Escherichia coli]|nr:hypothetical protein [Escherichia coli]